MQDWQIRREFKRIPGIIDVSTFGGTTKEYHVELDPGELISYDVTLDQVMDALAKNNADVEAIIAVRAKFLTFAGWG